MTALIAMLGGVRATAFAALALAALAWGGIQSHRVGSWQDKAAAAQSRVETAEERIEGFRQLLVGVNAAADEQLERAKAQAEAGAKAAAAARAERNRLAESLSSARRALEAAKAEPTCAEQLKVELCAAIPLL